MNIKDSKQLLTRFPDLQNKNQRMKFYVEKLTQELEDYDIQIKSIKAEIDFYNTQGNDYNVKKREKKRKLKQKILDEEKKKAILQSQYSKALEALRLIKTHLVNILSSSECD